MSTSTEIHSRKPQFHDTDNAYILPNDPIEHGRLLDQHESFVAMQHGRVHHATAVTSPSKVLDVGCGTGVVTRHLASTFPSAEVCGIDFSPVPTEPTDPKNLSFIRGDFRKLAGQDERLQYESVDYYFSRLLCCGMTDWQSHVNNVYKLLKPGAWAEMGDFVEDVFYEDEHVSPHDEWEWLRELRAGGKRKGLDLDAGLHIEEYMKNAGFVEVKKLSFKIPYWRDEENPDSWKVTEHMIGDKWGLYWHMIPKLVEGYEGEEIEKLQLQSRKDFEEEKGKYQLFCVTLGRKPENP